MTDEDRTLLERDARADAMWCVDRFPCRGPCWSGYWTISRELSSGEVEHVRNEAGKIKRFRSETTAEQEACRMNGVLWQPKPAPPLFDKW